MIQVDHIKFDYIRRDEQDNVVAVENAIRDVSFTVAPGEFVAILGHNGSGKSTLAKHMNALLVPEEGTIWVDSIDTKDKEMIWDIRQRVGIQCSGRRCGIWPGKPGSAYFGDLAEGWKCPGKSRYEQIPEKVS